MINFSCRYKRVLYSDLIIGMYTLKRGTRKMYQKKPLINKTYKMYAFKKPINRNMRISIKKNLLYNLHCVFAWFMISYEFGSLSVLSLQGSLVRDFVIDITASNLKWNHMLDMILLMWLKNVHPDKIGQWHLIPHMYYCLGTFGIEIRAKA